MVCLVTGAALLSGTPGMLGGASGMLDDKETESVRIQQVGIEGAAIRLECQVPLVDTKRMVIIIEFHYCQNPMVCQ